MVHLVPDHLPQMSSQVVLSHQLMDSQALGPLLLADIQLVLLHPVDKVLEITAHPIHHQTTSQVGHSHLHLETMVHQILDHQHPILFNLVDLSPQLDKHQGTTVHLTLAQVNPVDLSHHPMDNLLLGLACQPITDQYQ